MSWEKLTSRQDGPEIRIMAIPALPGAVERAYMMSSPRNKLCFELEWRSLCESFGGSNGRLSCLEADRFKVETFQRTAMCRLREKKFRRYSLAFDEAFESIDSKSPKPKSKEILFGSCFSLLKSLNSDLRLWFYPPAVATLYLDPHLQQQRMGKLKAKAI